MPDEGAGDKGQDSDVVIATGRYPFYRRYHSDALRGMSKLTLEQRGAYDLVLDMTYENGGPIDDDDAHLARQANCSPRKWRAVKAELIAAGKLLSHEGKLWNGRAMLELNRAQRLHLDKAEAGAKGAKIRAEKRSNSETKTSRKLAEFETKPNKNKAPSLAELEIETQLPDSITRESSSTEPPTAPTEQAGPPSPSIGGGPATDGDEKKARMAEALRMLAESGIGNLRRSDDDAASTP